MRPHGGQTAQGLQQRWSEVSSQHTCFIGASTGYGVHEDGFIGGQQCAEHLLHVAARQADTQDRVSAA